MTTLRLGTRKSPLALAQAHLAQEALSHEGISTKIVCYQTSGDLNKKPLRFTEGKGLFIKELEQGLLNGDIDLAVHSYKDIPYELTPGLIIAGVLKREDARDVMLTSSPLPKNAFKTFPGMIGTCSLRRNIQLQSLFPKARIVDIRGNIQTRIRKMQEGAVDALVLAYAGLKRLAYNDHIAYVFPIDELIASPTQGTIALQCRDKDFHIQNILQSCNHSPTQDMSHIERGFVTAIEGTCQTPLAGHAHVLNGHIIFKGMLAAPDGSGLVKIDDSCPLAKIENFFHHGYMLGQQILKMHHENTHYPKS